MSTPSDVFLWLLPGILGLLPAFMFSRLYLKASQRADDNAVRIAELRGETDALRRFIGCKCELNRRAQAMTSSFSSGKAPPLTPND